MAERNQAETPETEQSSNMTTPSAPAAAKWPLYVGGTMLILAVGMIFMQYGRGRDGNAAETKQVPAQAPATKPLAKVGSTMITYDQVAAETMERYGNEILEQIISRTIIEQACRDKGITVTAAEVDQEIVTIAKGFNLDPMNWMQMLQAERGLTALQYKRDVIWPMLALKKLAGTDVEVTEADINRVFMRDFGPRVKAKMIMLDNFRRAEGVWQQAKAAPDDFGKLAQEHSVEPSSKALGGDIPPIRRYSGQPELEEAAFKLQPGEVSALVEMPFSGTGIRRWVILKCEGRTEPVVSGDEIAVVREQIVDQVKKEKVQESVAKVFSKLQEETRVDNYVTNETKGGVKQTSAFTPAGADSGVVKLGGN